MMYFKYRSICITEYYHIWDCLKFRRNINLFCHSMHNSKPHYLSSLKSREKNFGVFPITIQNDFIVFTVLISLVFFDRNVPLCSKTLFLNFCLFSFRMKAHIQCHSIVLQIYTFFPVKSILHLNHSLTPTKLQKGRNLI